MSSPEPESEGEGDVIRPRGLPGQENDSSEEEEEDDEEEIRRVREGFIVDDEDEDEDENEEGVGEDERKKRRKRNKKKRKRASKDSDDALDEDDLELLAENARPTHKRHRGDASNTAAGSASSTRDPTHAKNTAPGADSDSDEEIPSAEALSNMFDADGPSAAHAGLPSGSASLRPEVEADDDDMAGFITSDDEEDDDGEDSDGNRANRGGGADGASREARKRARKEQKERNRRRMEAVGGASRATRQDLDDVFGMDEYSYAMNGDEDGLGDGEAKVTIQDVFDPSEIAERYLLPQDLIIKEEDYPERHQLVNSTLSRNPVYHDPKDFPPIDSATSWVAPRLSARTKQLFYGISEHQDGQQPQEALTREDLREEYVAAVHFALHAMFVDHWEVPYIWIHKRDKIIQQTPELRDSVTYIQEDELWTCYDLGMKYKAIHNRRTNLQNLYDQIRQLDETFSDEYFEDHVLAVPDGTAETSVEASAEAMAWLEMRYPKQVESVKIHEVNKRRAIGSTKRRAREGALGDYMKHFGITPAQVAVKLKTGSDEPVSAPAQAEPKELAERYLDPLDRMSTGVDVQTAARRLLTEEIGKDPVLLQLVRDRFRAVATVDIHPTPRGKTKLDDLHLYYPFKYVRNKSVAEFYDTPVFSQMMAAENEGLVTVNIKLPEDKAEDLEEAILEAWKAQGDGELEATWTAVRREIIVEAISTYLLPAGSAWMKEELREQTETLIGQSCQKTLFHRVNTLPYATVEMEAGDSPSVIAVTFGRGGRDAIQAVFVDDQGRTKSHQQFNDFDVQDDKDAFLAMVESQSPRVIVIGGYTAETLKLDRHVGSVLLELGKRALASEKNIRMGDINGEAAMEAFERDAMTHAIPKIYVRDEVARIYAKSDRARIENPSWPENARYALGLARYAQDPLNEYCALDADIAAITYQENYQGLINQEKLLQYLERALVNCVNQVGVDIQRATREPYAQKLLPFVSGLGPRKADALTKALVKEVNGVTNRKAIMNVLFPNGIHNTPAFLYIHHDDLQEADLGDKDNDEAPDPMDMTRVHHSDYPLAYELLENIYDLDPAVVETENMSKYALEFMQDEHAQSKITALDLEAFDVQIKNRSGEYKTYLLRFIVQELLASFQDKRPQFAMPPPQDVMTMLTGETAETLGRGKLVTAYITRTTRDKVFIKLESGMVGEIAFERLADPLSIPHGARTDSIVNKGQQVRGVIYDVDPANLSVQMSLLPQDIAQVVNEGQGTHRDYWFDLHEEARDAEEYNRQRKAEDGPIARIVNHPAWRVWNRKQTEMYLAGQNRGDAIIRPSSKGDDRLGITWKVDEGIYQHIDVLELDKPNQYELGRILRVNNESSYMDLDELLVNHVQAMASKVERLMQHEKYKPANMLDTWLRDYVRAHPGSSAYGFTLDKAKPGWAKVTFLNKSEKDGGTLVSWPIRIMPGAYKLFDAEVPGVPELCSAFKTQFQTRMEEQRTGVSGRTPMGRGHGATPSGRATPGGRTPGGRTPGLISRTPMYAGQSPFPRSAPAGLYSGTPSGMPGRVAGTPSFAYGANPYLATPNPYNPMPVNPYNPTPNPYAAAPPPPPTASTPYGAPPPPPPFAQMAPPPVPQQRRPPSTMNPARAMLIAQSEQNGHQR